MSKKIIAANWKMNHGFNEVDEWLDLFYENLPTDKSFFDDRELVLFPPLFMIDYVDSELMEEGFATIVGRLRCKRS